MDKLNTTGAESSSDRQDASPSPSYSSTSHQTEQLRLQREFDFTMAMANLISELVRVMGWDRNQQPPESPVLLPGGGRATKEEPDEEPRPVLRSIFQPRFCSSPVILTSTSAGATTAATPPKKKTGNGYKTRSDFASRSAYVEYVQDNLKSGMMVRMLEDYEEVSAGDEGDFRYSNDGSPPVQVRRRRTRSSSSLTVSRFKCNIMVLFSGLLELPIQDLLGPLAHGGDPGHQSDGEGDAGEGVIPDRDPQTKCW